MTAEYFRPATPKSSKPLRIWGPVLGALSFLVISLFAIMFYGVQYGNLDLRRSADSVNRNVELVFVPSSTPLRADTLSTIFVKVNTHGEKIDGVQVVFDLKTEVTDGVTLKLKEPGGLRKVGEKVEGIPGGKRISFALITSDPNSPYSNGSPIDVAEVIFTASKPGNMDIIFDDVQTKATKHKQTDNVMKPYVAIAYDVDVAPSPLPTPTPKTTTTTSSSTSTSTTKTTSAKGGTKAPVAKVVVSSVAAPLPTPGVDLSICNTSCAVASDCGSGFLCYRQQCRRIGNVNSSTCTSESDTDSQLCNETCASSTDCTGGLICYQNSCRDAENPENVSCQKPALSEAEAIAELCSSSCTTNSECGDSLSCYKGECRLASNPTSEVCVADTDSEDEVAESPSPSPSPEEVADDTTNNSNLFSSILRGLLILGALVGVGVAGVMGYLWWQDRQSGDL